LENKARDFLRPCREHDAWEEPQHGAGSHLHIQGIPAGSGTPNTVIENIKSLDISERTSQDRP
jgi:hypothetical protein